MESTQARRDERPIAPWLKKAGLVYMALFLSTGLFFLVMMGGLQQHEIVERILLRSTHVYLFWAAMVCWLWGSLPPGSAPAGRVGRIFDILMLLSPALVFAGILFETRAEDMHRPVTGIGVLTPFFAFTHLLWQRMRA